jgi:hypothetical protein
MQENAVSSTHILIVYKGVNQLIKEFNFPKSVMWRFRRKQGTRSPRQPDLNFTFNILGAIITI